MDSCIFSRLLQCTIFKSKKTARTDRGVLQLLHRLNEKVEITTNDRDVAEWKRENMGINGEKLSEVTKKTVESKVLEYLSEKREFLPQFYIPKGGNEKGEK